MSEQTYIDRRWRHRSTGAVHYGWHEDKDDWEPVVVLPQAEAARLQALVAAVRDDALRKEYASITIPAAIMLPAYIAALLARMEGK